MMGEFLPNDTPLDETYWRALLEEGEHSRQPAPMDDAETVWLGLSMEEENSISPRPHSGSNDGWDAALKALEEAIALDLAVVGYNRGGLLVEWNGRQGFVPVSHLTDFPSYLDEGQREQELQARVGHVLHLRVIEVDSERSRLVLSERATHDDEARRREMLENLTPGTVCQGHVTNICSFGAFVDLGGLEGLVHVSEVSWGRVDHPSDALSLGQEVQVRVLNIDQERGRVGLSIKLTQPDPWRTVDERYQVGQIVEGTITNVVDFGAFAQVEEGLEGLIHISELAEGSFLHPRNVVSEGQKLLLKVISVNGERRRLGLSLRQGANPDDVPSFVQGTGEQV